MPASGTPSAAEVSAAAEGTGTDKRRFVRAMFSDIAPRYDFLNHLLSLNLDRRWRRQALRMLQWEQRPRGTYLDLCAGTLDIAAMLASTPGFAGHVVAADFAEPMLRAGQRKVSGLPVASLTGDALALPLRSGSCAGAIVGFGIRNVAGLDDGLREVARVLQPGARFVILEFTTPQNPLFRAGYHFYFHHVTPRIGGFVSGNRSAYEYLPESVAHFPGPGELARRMEAAGFRDVQWRSLTFGVLAIHVGTR